MIPRSLQIRNFLSYGDEPQTIDFSSYRLICLSGKNGHGKSALLDAMSWAIWGQARKIASSSKADEGLLRLGQDTMMVIFDFELNGTQFRVKREFIHRYGKPVTSLEFGILDTATDGYKPLTGKTIRETQAAIENTIKLTFESFTNSAFLRQGQSNEFSKKSPRERKEILANILGLDAYDVIRKKALEKIRAESLERATLHAIQTALQQDIAHAQTIQQEMRHIQEQLQALEQEQLKLVHDKKELDQLQQTIATRQQQYALVSYQKETLTQEQQTLNTTLRTKVTEWRTLQTQQRTPTAHTDLEAERARLSRLLTQCQEAQQTQLALKEQLLTQKETAHLLETTHAKHQAQELQKIELARERLQSDLLNHTTTRTDLERQLQTVTTQLTQITQQQTHLHTQQAPSAQKVAQLDPIEHQFLKRKTCYQKFIAHANWLTSQLRGLEQKQTLVTAQQNPSCPLCEQNLSAARRRFLCDKFIDQEQFITHQLSRLSRVISALKTLLFAQHEVVESLKKEKDMYLQRQATLIELDKQLSTLKTSQEQLQTAVKDLDLKNAQAQKQYTVLTQQLAHLKTQGTTDLAQHELYQATVQTIRQLEQDIAKHEYQKSVHETTQLQLAHIERTIAHQKEFATQYALQEARTTEIQTLIAHAKKIKQSLIQLETTLTQYQSLTTDQQRFAQLQDQYSTAVQTYTSAKEQALQHKGRLENRLAVVEAQKIQHAQNQKQLAVLDESIADYDQIATATSKDGIQALLIEDAIPEIEQEANNLLARLTNNQAQLFIESLKDLKGGGTKETLDIKISDSAGIRPYELFSGGEAFRIDFALRIAISKLLARRAGTALQTLIIDEGFGSQDDEGLSHIMDAMYTIQEDFQKIIIVSHLPSMKNQFPVHFVVEKKPSGSRVTVIEQD